MDRRNPFVLMDPPPLPPSGDRPLEVCLLRGSSIESRHRVHAIVTKAEGDMLYHWGNPELRFFPRSAIKILQAASWLTPALQKRWEISSEELALACASHWGEPYHLAKVSSWLQRLGLSEENLECGSHSPYDKESSDSLVREGKQPCQLHNNCSGKHTGLLTACKERNWDISGYSKYDHPVQGLVRDTLSRFFELDMASMHWGIDGCGIPTYSVPLSKMAGAMARTANVGGQGSVGDALKTLNRAIGEHPKFMGGTKSFCSQVVEHSEGRVFAKVGAEGVYAGWIPKIGVGIAMKCEDGNPRATECAMVAILRELGYRMDFYSPLVKRWTGEVVGQMFCA